MLALLALATLVPTLSFALPALEGRASTLAKVVTSCTVPGTAALTFDDGPYQYLKDIVDKLNAANAKGTFFFNGNNWDCIYNQPQSNYVAYAYQSGHQIGSHTWSHAHLNTLTSDELFSEFNKTQVAIKKITGAKVAYTRPPYGEYNDLVRQVAKQQGQTLALWDFDSEDSDGATIAQSKANYDQLAQNHPSSVLALNHETYFNTVYKVLPHAIYVLQKAGYKLVTLSECLGGSKPYLYVGKPQKRDSTWTC